VKAITPLATKNCSPCSAFGIFDFTEEYMARSCGSYAAGYCGTRPRKSSVKSYKQLRRGGPYQ